MTDRLEELKAALKGRYEIEQEAEPLEERAAAIRASGN